MKIFLVHNQKAGSDGHDDQQLVGVLQQAGHEVQLLPLDSELNAGDCELVVVAGGDGTVGKTVRRFYATMAEANIPLAIIPVGTANNIAANLGLQGGLEDRARAWQECATASRAYYRKFHIGSVGVEDEQQLFLESVGCGLLTQLIRLGDEEKAAGKTQDRESELRTRRQNLQSLLANANTCYYEITVDGQNYSGDYLLAEVMNINRIGPGLEFSPHSDQSDDLFELVLISGSERAAMAKFLANALENRTPDQRFVRASGKEIVIVCRAGDAHIDDKRLEGSRSVSLRMRAQAKPLRILP